MIRHLIRMRSRCLKHVVQMDPNYAPAWEAAWAALLLRCDLFRWRRSRCSSARTRLASGRWQLDPNRIVAAGQLISNALSAENWARHIDEAQELVKRRPESAQAHFVMSYVYRYAGMLEQSAGECDTALALDPGNYSFRSCAWAFMELGRHGSEPWILCGWMRDRSGLPT